MTSSERATPYQRATNEVGSDVLNVDTAPASVLIVGAGPVGLTLACELAWRGLRVRIIDSQLEPSQHSKAIGVFPRTLELLENQGVVDEMLQRGVLLDGILLHAEGRRIATINTKRIGSRYNFILTLEQRETERILINRLTELGVTVERPVQLTVLENGNTGAHVVLTRQDAHQETLDIPWVVGCDGAHSFVRKAINLPFEGARYAEAFNLADVVMSGEPPEAQNYILLFLADSGPLFMAPLAQQHHYRLIADEPAGSAAIQRDTLTLEDVRHWWRERVSYPPAQNVELIKAEWLSRFTIHRRMVPRLRERHVVLAGDAAHIHSPAGAQGMNGGMQDAVNLAWKLALVVHGRSPETLLDTYEEERLPITRTVLQATHLFTKLATVHRPALRMVRNRVMGVVLNTPLQRQLVNVAAGLRVHYRHSSLVYHEHTSVVTRWAAQFARRRGPHAGERAPDVVFGQDRQRLYQLLHHVGHTLLVFIGVQPTTSHVDQAVTVVHTIEQHYGDAIRSYIVAVQGPFPIIPGTAPSTVWDADRKMHEQYGMQKAGLCLVRPDRYIACRTATLDVTSLQPVLEQVFTHERHSVTTDA